MKPFSVIQNEPQYVKDKYLEGVPWKDNFPGPFQGMTNKQQNEYMRQQQFSVNNYSNIAEKPLEEEAEKYLPFNVGLPNCSSYNLNTLPNTPVIETEYRGPPSMNNMNNGNVEIKLPMQESIKRGKQGPYDVREDFKDESITDPCNQTGFGNMIPKFHVSLKDIENATNIDPSASSNKSSENSFESSPSVQSKSTLNINNFKKCPSDDNPLLDVENRPIQHFSHNNMVPYYGSKVTQNMYSTGVSQAGDNNSCNKQHIGYDGKTPYKHKLGLFTGCDENDMHKRETGPLFSPAEQQTGWVFGTPSFRPDLDRFKTSIWRRNHETPVEKVQVGPGIGLDYSVPAEGGFHQFVRILPNNISDYKSNQLENRIYAGKWFVDHPTSQYTEGVSKNKPTVEITQARRPTMPNKFYTNSPSGDSSNITNYDITANRGKQNREDTSSASGFGSLNLNKYRQSGEKERRHDVPNGMSEKEHLQTEHFQTENGEMPCIDFSSAPIGKTMKSIVPKPSQSIQSYNTIRETFKKGNVIYDSKTGKMVTCLDKPQGAEKWDLIMGPATGSSKSIQRSGWHANFTDRGDANPYIINLSGTANRGGGLWNPSTYQDNARTTRKETTLYNHSGNVTGSTKKPYQMTWTDSPNTTRKETTSFSYAGNVTGSSKKPYQMTWTDSPNTTRKETTSFSYAGNAASKNLQMTDRFMYDGNDFFNT